MAEKIQMLALSPTMERGRIVKWLKGEGDEIASGDVICEVETDKATMEYESINEGTILKIIVGEGKDAAIGDTIAIVGEKGEDISGVLAEIERGREKEKMAVEGGSREGESRVAGEEAEEAKATATAGVSAGELFTARSTDESTAKSAARSITESAIESTAESAAGGIPSGKGRVKASPLAKKIARDAGIDISSVRGTGPEGRVVKRDVEGFLRAGSKSAAFGRTEIKEAEGLRGRKIPVTGMRKVIAERLSNSKFQSPHYYLKLTVEVESLMEARRRLNESVGKKVSFNAFLLKFVAEALKRNPQVNAGWFGDYIEYFPSVDIGIAVALENGLITPVVKNCEKLGILDIDGELELLIERAKAGKLKPDEYSGATFTISNLGSFGIEEFTAIINPPGSAILAVGSIAEQVVSIDGIPSVRKLMKLTLSCDHRVIDGAVGARFLKDLKDIIEEPIRALY